MKDFSIANVLNIATLDVCGFYELEAQGTVLYSRLKSGDSDKRSDSLIKRNFFEEVFSCQNIADLRRCFRNFVSANITTESFIFACEIFKSMIPINVMFVRVLGDKEKEPLFYIEINQA